MKKRKKVNKKKSAFTLIELLATIVIIIIVFLIAMFVIPNVMGGVYKRVCSINEGMMEKSAFNYFSLGKGGLPSKEGESKEVTLDKLINSKFIKEIKDPKTKLACDRENSKTVITRLNGKYQFKTNLNCNTCISEIIDSNELEEELWDGWIKLTLFYPESSTERKWRLGEEGELRLDPMLHWQDYTGPIIVPLNRVEDVWISYIMDGKEYVIPPVGTLLVDIVPDKIGEPLVNLVNVKINFDETAETKEYRVGSSGWMPYTGPFKVTENTFVEARAKKKEQVYDVDGNLIATRNVAGRDLVYIGNIGINEEELEAPLIERLPAIDDNEVARVKITYPAGANKKIFKLNYGIEENYVTEISVKQYGTYIIGYYYNAEGKRSQARGIRINDTTMEPESPVEDYIPKPPYKPGTPPPVTESWIPAPVINLNPLGGRVEEVEVSVNAPANADKVYLKLGRYGKFEEYKNPVIVRENMQVYAYYRTYEGYRSETGYEVVRNIKQPGKPFVRINADPYPTNYNYGQKEVKITIDFEDSNINEYSLDGLNYIPYKGEFTITKNTRIYAKGINDNGIGSDYLDVTNIGAIPTPPPMKILDVSISAVPEPKVSTTKYGEVKVTIDYDERATSKYYRIGRYGSLQEYKGTFTVDKSTTIYAYATAKNARGEASKIIDNLLLGISDPIIYAEPKRDATYKVSISIEYDQYATIKRYSIDNGPLRDYVNAFEVSKNGALITAHSMNADGEIAESTYKVENIIPTPPVLLLDAGKYFILKLNYPPKSTGREYKWKQDGIWTTYKSDGIILIKPQYKDELIKNGTIIKIKNENGDVVTFNGDYYLIDVPINEVSEHLFMRWDKETPPSPQIIPDTTEPTRTVNVTILYDKTMVKKEYKIVTKDGVSGDWLEYKGPINIDKKNTLIYARGMNSSEVWSNETVRKIGNIDDEAPTLTVTGDLETPQQKVSLKVSAVDDVKIGFLKWESGVRDANYFSSKGKEIGNNSIVTVTSNGDYTFYVTDQVGNTKVVVVKVTNVDTIPPKIDIAVTPETKVGTTANVTIDYNDSIIKQYKVGTSNATWLTYNGSFPIDSYNILSKGWQNEDKTVTIYAKGKDTAGNEITVTKKILNIDLDIPKAPVVTSNYGYPTLTSYGVTFDGSTKIEFDTRLDIDNYYSTDNGVTWLTYKGEFQSLEGTVKAKSVKRDTGLTAEVTKQINMPSDAMPPTVYDGDDSTLVRTMTNARLQIDSSVIGKIIRIKWSTYVSGPPTLKFLDKNNNLIQSFTQTATEQFITIPNNSQWITITSTSDYVYEIGISNEPTFNATNGYMLLHADAAKVIRKPYQMVTINYFPTSVERLYRIGNNGDWMVYRDIPIWVDQGETIYAKGIDKYGNEGRLISQHTSNVSDSLSPLIYDEDDSTFVRSMTNARLQIDSSVIGKIIRIKWSTYVSVPPTLKFLDKNNNLIQSFTQTSTEQFITIPNNSQWITITSTTDYVYEIGISNEPTFNATNGYMLLHADAAKVIRKPYQMVSINYFPTSVERLYRIGNNGDWKVYRDIPIWVDQGETIYAKGIDKYGNEGRLISQHTSNVSDSLSPLIYDEDDSTFVRSMTNARLQIDSSVIGKIIRIKWSTYVSGPPTLKFLDNNNNLIQSFTQTSTEQFITIPNNSQWITITSTTDYVYEIELTN